MKNPIFNIKSVIKSSYKANVGARAGSGARAGTSCRSRNFFKVGDGVQAGVRAETKSFGSTTLITNIPFKIWTVEV